MQSVRFLKIRRRHIRYLFSLPKQIFFRICYLLKIFRSSLIYPKSKNDIKIKFITNPKIILHERDQYFDSEGINGATVIKVPNWVNQKEISGKFLIYFASHNGKYIRVAVANKLDGSWKVLEQHALHLNDCAGFFDHIASPEVVINNSKKRIDLVFHGKVKGFRGQMSGVAMSENCLDFYFKKMIPAKYYFRCLKTNFGLLCISKSWDDGGGEIFTMDLNYQLITRPTAVVRKMRHCCLTRIGKDAILIYSKVGDLNEPLYFRTLSNIDDANSFKISDAKLLRRPTSRVEGVDLPNLKSRRGKQISVKQLRDPYLLEDEGRFFLFYNGRGEECILQSEIELKV